MSDELITEERAQELAGMFGGDDPLDEESAKDLIDGPKKKDESPAEEEPKQQEEKWVHEPTGKSFESELDLLRYESGWKSQEFGTKLKELQEQFKESQEQPKEEAPPQKVDEKEIMKQIWPDLDEETLDDPAMKLFYKGLDRTAGILQQQFESKLESLREENNQLRSSLEEDKVRAQFGVEPSVEQKILEKHPGLKQLPAKERMAVMKELVANEEPARSSPKLADKIPTQNVEDHVETSVKSSPPSEEGFQGWLEKDFAEKSIPEQQSALTEMINRAGQKGAFDLY